MGLNLYQDFAGMVLWQAAEQSGIFTALGPARARLLSHIYSWSNPKDPCPVLSNDEIVENTGLAGSTVIKGKKDLEAAGLLITRPASDGRTLYKLADTRRRDVAASVIARVYVIDGVDPAEVESRRLKVRARAEARAAQKRLNRAKEQVDRTAESVHRFDARGGACIETMHEAAHRQTSAGHRSEVGRPTGDRSAGPPVIGAIEVEPRGTEEKEREEGPAGPALDTAPAFPRHEANPAAASNPSLDGCGSTVVGTDPVAAAVFKPPAEPTVEEQSAAAATAVSETRERVCTPGRGPVAIPSVPPPAPPHGMNDAPPEDWPGLQHWLVRHGLSTATVAGSTAAMSLPPSAPGGGATCAGEDTPVLAPDDLDWSEWLT